MKKNTAFYAWAMSCLLILTLGACSSSGNKNSGEKETQAETVSNQKESPQKKEAAGEADKSNKEASRKPLQLDERFYKQFEGMLNGNIPLIFDIVKNGDNLMGSYLYSKHGIPIPISGKMETGNMMFKEYDEEHQELATITLTPVANGLTGKWENTKGNKAFNIELKENTGEETIPFDLITDKDSLQISKHGTVASASYDYLLLFPKNARYGKGKTVADLILDTYKRTKIYQEKARGENDLKAIQEIYKKEEFDLFKDEIELVDDPGDMGFLNWSNSTSEKIVYNKKGVLCIENSSYSYMGGAHGNYGASYSVIEVESGMNIGFLDLFKEGAKSELTKLITEALKKKYGTEKGQNLKDIGFFEDSVSPNDNIILTGGGIGFFYNPYEVAPYAMGTSSVFFKFKEIKHLLDDGSPVARLYQ